MSWVFAAVLLGILLAVLHARVKHVQPTIWSMAANIAAALAYVWVFFVLNAGWWWTVLIMGLFQPLLIMANQAAKYDVKLGMRRRSERATRIMQQVLSKHGSVPPNFGLYLRPFVTTDRLPAQTGPSELGIPDARAYLQTLGTLRRCTEET